MRAIYPRILLTQSSSFLTEPVVSFNSFFKLLTSCCKRFTSLRICEDVDVCSCIAKAPISHRYRRTARTNDGITDIREGLYQLFEWHGGYFAVNVPIYIARLWILLQGIVVLSERIISVKRLAVSEYVKINAYNALILQRTHNAALVPPVFEARFKERNDASARKETQKER